jgi:DHA1 family bicyclomycin/chloramphenicol resistance-like MFS transporter
MEPTFAAPVARPIETRPAQLVKLVIILGALTAFNSMSIDMYLPAFPQMSKDLAVPLGTVQLSISAFLVGSAIGQLIYGPLSDRWGRKLPLLYGLGIYAVANLACALIHSGEALLFWRVVMALGGGASIVISRAVVRDLYDTTEAARMLSLLMLAMGAAPILAPLLGGQFLLFTGWRGIFAFLGVFGVLSLWGTVAWLPESLPAERRIPRRFREMMTIYGGLLRHRRYLCYALALGAVAGLNFSYIAGAPQFFIELHGISPQLFGLLFGLNASGLIGASQLNRRLLRRYSARRILGAAFAFGALAAALLAASIVTGVGGFPAQAILIFGCLCTTGLSYPNVMALALEPFPAAAGSASALMGMMQYSLGALAGVFVGLNQNETALPMVLTMTGCAFIGSLAFLLATTEAAQPAPSESFDPGATELN